MTIFVSLKTGSQRRGSRKQARKPAPGAASGGQRFVEIDLILKGRPFAVGTPLAGVVGVGL